MNRDRIHLKAPGNWINDPNGFIYYGGKYHLFYQYFPYAPVWGTMHWGHAVSEDLVNWEHLGVALFPTQCGDQNGCFSGSAVEHEGRMYLYYTGIHYHRADPRNIHLCPEDDFESAQMMIISEDGMHFDNFKDKSMVVPVMSDNGPGDMTHTRDPKVWRGKNGWYMVLGSKTQDNRGELLFYRSQDLMQWDYVNTASKENGLGWMWECPDYFEIPGGKVLIISPMGLLSEEPFEGNQTVCMPVEFDEDTCSMQIPDEYQYMDYGLDLYAPQTTTDAEGRRVLTAWLRMPEAVKGGWIGMFCIPRVVETEKGHIYFRVHPNIEKKYTRKISHPAQADSAGYRVSLALKEGERVSVGGYQISRKDGRICTDRSGVFPNNTAQCRKFRMQAATPEVKEGYRLDIYVDENLVEVFVNHGEYVISNAVYGLTKEIQTDSVGRIEIYSLEESD